MPLAIYLLVLIELIVVSFLDLKTRKISNKWSLLNLVLFLIFVFLLKDIYTLSWETVFYSLSFFFVGFLLFAMKIMGGGDAKLLASLYLLIPARVQEESFMLLIYSTILIGGGILSYKIWIQRDQLKLAFFTQDYSKFRIILGKKFPFSPVILLAWISWGISHFLI